MLRCSLLPAMRGSGYSQRRARRPKRRFRHWRMGMGFMAGSRVLVRKSQRILGQKMAWREAASWSRGVSGWWL